MALDYGFYVEGLGFNTYITRETPLERATAQFRKDQFDSTPTVGDQSLAGWWTRGQLSFHRGAGIKYYELLGDSDDSVQNRFRHSLGINPWTAGEVGLANSFTDIDLTNILDVVPASTGIAALKGDGSVQLVDSALGTSLGSYTDEGVVSLASDGAEIFACTPSAIETEGAITRHQYVTNPAMDPAGDTTFATAQGGTASLTFAGSGDLTFTTATAETDGVRFAINAVPVAEPRTNLITNPSFETNTTGWISDGTTGSALTRTTTTSRFGTASAALSSSVTAWGAGWYSPHFVVTAGSTYTATASIRQEHASTDDSRVEIMWYSDSAATVQLGAFASASPTGSLTKGVWYDGITETATAPFGAVSARVGVFINVSSAVAATYGCFDGVAVEAVAGEGIPSDPYFDGSTTDLAGYTCEWEGTPHASRSLATGVAAATPDSLLCRVTADKAMDLQVWDGTTYTSVGQTTAGVRKSFIAASDEADGDVKFQLMAVAGSTGATTISDVSASSSLAESATPNAVDDVRWSWYGTTNSSAQTRAVAAGELSVLWVPPSGSTWSGCWYVKNRLIALDNSGRWYALSPTSGGVVAAADSFWNSGHASGWTLAEGPSAVYFARLNEIFSLTLTDDGLLPSVTAARVAAQLPYGETIASIYAYLGQLLICTSSGVRTALIGDSGELAYGSRFIRGDFSRCGRIAAKGDLAYVTGTAEDDDGPSVFMVNLTESVTDLVPAYAELVSMDDDPYGGCLGADGLVYLFDDTGLLREASTIGTTGYLTTGFHRLGTLDPKVFRYVRVKTEGTVGSVTVSVLTPDGQEHAVGSVSAGDTDELDLGAVVGLPGSLEYLAIKFTLAGDGTDGPTLLGYQLKALPLPKRQRMIRVPLMLFDKEENRHGQQMAADAWDRLAALEALEASNALVAFEDKETGETGSAYIESIEVRRVAPAARSEGFGGLVYLTLRKV